MPGCIIGCVGKQRSGKTLIAYKLAKMMYRACSDEGYKLRVYTNLWCPDDPFDYVTSIDQIPLDLEPKIVLIDEIYNGLDAQDYKKLKNVSIFVNTIGKQNCLFIFTTIKAGMVYNRVRDQMNFCFLVKSAGDCIDYKFVNCDNLTERTFQLKKDAECFQDVLYDTNFVPPEFDWSMKEWESKLKEYWSQYYGI